MRKIILEKLIYKNYLKTALTSILFIEIALLLIYFSANKNMVDKSIDFISKDIKKSVNTIVYNITAQTEHRFQDIESIVYVLQNEHQNFFKYKYKINDENLPVFDYSKNGMYHKSVDNGGSSVIVSQNTEITQNFKSKIINTEVFDNTFKSVVDNNKMIVAAYFNSYDNMSRYYPFIKEIYNTFPRELILENYDFYNKANLKNNPEKKVVWTDVYLDPLGQGWMISAIAPIYYNNFLEGVTGIDVTINSIIDNFLDFKLPFRGSSFLIDKDGKVIAMTKKIENILQVKNHKSYTYEKNKRIRKTIYPNNKNNIFENKNKKLVEVLRKVVNGSKSSFDVSINDNKYILFADKLNRTPWFLVSLIDKNDIGSEVRELESYYNKLGYLIIALIILFYLLFFLYLYIKAKRFVKAINTPLLKIINMTKNLVTNEKIEKLEECGIVEIDALSENFNNLSRELDERTKKLVSSETQRVINEKLANTDALTKVYNRRFLEDFSNNYIKILKREKTTLSLLLIDIDNFKNINDSYGHDVGDSIIKTLVERIKNVIRENDIIVRLGGDEFVVLLPKSNISNARKIANKLISTINNINQLEKMELVFTVSIGSSEYLPEDKDIDNLIKRADKSLYKAKELGKNCVQ